MEHSCEPWLGDPQVAHGRVEAGDRPAVHVAVLPVARVHPQHVRLVGEDPGVGRGAAEGLRPVRRQALEVLAARRAAERIDDAGLRRLGEVLEEGRRALEADDHVWSGSVNTAFHETVLDLAGNESLRDLLEPLSGRLKWLFRQTSDYPRVQAEHAQLFAALAAALIARDVVPVLVLLVLLASAASVIDYTVALWRARAR